MDLPSLTRCRKSENIWGAVCFRRAVLRHLAAMSLCVINVFSSSSRTGRPKRWVSGSRWTALLTNLERSKSTSSQKGIIFGHAHKMWNRDPTAQSYLQNLLETEGKIACRNSATKSFKHFLYKPCTWSFYGLATKASARPPWKLHGLAVLSISTYKDVYEMVLRL